MDLEWNQSPYGKENGNKLIPFEIIEIGAVKLDEELNIVDTFSSLVYPVVYNELHYIIKDLTGFTMKKLKKGKPFTEVASNFMKWCGDDYIFCTWGSLDVTELQRNLSYYRLPLPKAPVYYYDLQKIFNLIYDNGDKSTRSLEYAVNHLKLEKNNAFHRALDDAKYAACVMQCMDISILRKYFSVDYYQSPAKRSQEIHLVFDNYSKFVSKEFETKNDAIKDRVVSSTICYKCGKKARKKIRWFSDNAKLYYCLSLCPEHGLLKGKIRMKKSVNDKYFVVKTLKLTDETGASKIKQRQLDIRAKRKKKMS